MLKRIVSGIMLAVLLTSMLILEFNIQQAKAEPKTWTVDDDGPADFSKIQDAINAASLGDTICVRNGTYYENIQISKSLTLIGQDKSITIVDGKKTSSVIHVMADNVNISGLTIQNSSVGLFDGVGVFLDYSNSCTIDNNVMQYNERDIFVWNSNGNNISRNILRFSAEGYTLNVWGRDNTIVDNIVYQRGIGIVDSGGNTFRNNTMGQFSVSGRFLADYMNDVDTSNTVSGKPIYYWINQQNRQVPPDAGVVVVVNSTGIIARDLTLVNVGDGMVFAFTNDSWITNIVSQRASYGIRLDYSYNNIVSGNRVSDNMLGIFLSNSENNSVTGNTAQNNSWAGVFLGFSNGNHIRNNIMQNNRDTGISLEMSSYNTIAGNTIANNGFGGEYYPAGISFFNSPDNAIYHNNFIGNKVQVSRYSGEAIDSINTWDNGYPSGGNYWSNYTGTDLYSGPYQNETGSDRIGDTPHVIDVYNQDNYPLMLPRPILYVDPSLVGFWTPAYGKTFTVDVKVDNVSGLYGFEFKLYWDTTLLDLMNFNITPPSVWGTNYFVGMNDTREDLGRYWLAVAALNPAPSFNGSATLVKLTFKITYDPIYPNNVTSGLDVADTELSDSEANPIPHDAYGGEYNCYSTKPKLGMVPSTYTAKILSEVFTVNITVADVVSLYSFEFQLNYNSSFLDATEVTLGPFLKSPYHIKKQIIDDDAGVVWFSVESQPPAQSAYGSGMLASIKFRVQNESGVWYKGFVPLECDLNLSGTILKTNEGVLIPHDILNPLVHFAYTPIPGDLNSDGTVNIFDLRIVARAFGSVPGDLYWDLRADLNCDGEINLYDIVLVSKNYGRTTP